MNSETGDDNVKGWDTSRLPVYDKEIQPGDEIALESGYNIPKEGDSISEAGTIAGASVM